MIDFIIPYKGLGLGSHSFEFEIDEKFFERFEYFESEKGQLRVKLELLKESSLMDMHFTLEGNMLLTCDRCLGTYDFPVSESYRLIAKFGGSFEDETDEVVVLPPTESRIDLSQYIFEYINMALPICKAHEKEADCDPDMIEKLKNHSTTKSDPRWDALKNIDLK